MGILPSKNTTFDPTKDIPDLTGKVALVTGGHSGIGYETVKGLARRGAKVYIGSRTQAKATAAIWKLNSEGTFDSGGGKAIWLELDLSTPAGAKKAAEEFMKLETRLDILVNNAAVGTTAGCFDRVEGKIPVSVLMATNHLGPFVLTTTLLPVIKSTAALPDSDVRIVVLSSISQQTATVELDWKSSDGWLFKSGSFSHNTACYGTTKLANILFTKQLQRLFDEEKVDAIAIAIHPGTVKTDGFVNNMTDSWVGSIIYHVVFSIVPLLTPQEGAYNSLFAATAPAVKQLKNLYGGAYLVPYGKITEPNKEALDPVKAKDLWETTERVAREMQERSLCFAKI